MTKLSPSALIEQLSEVKTLLALFVMGEAKAGEDIIQRCNRTIAALQSSEVERVLFEGALKNAHDVFAAEIEALHKQIRDLEAEREGLRAVFETLRMSLPLLNEKALADFAALDRALAQQPMEESTPEPAPTHKSVGTSDDDDLMNYRMNGT